MNDEYGNPIHAPNDPLTPEEHAEYQAWLDVQIRQDEAEFDAWLDEQHLKNLERFSHNEET